MTISVRTLLPATALLVAAALLVLSRLDHPLVKALRLAVIELATPSLQLAREATEPIRRTGRLVGTYRELQGRLEQVESENRQLQSWQWRARHAEQQLAELGRLARAVETVETPLITCRIVADSNGPFARAALLNAGRGHGVRPGHAVVVIDALVGRIVEAGERASRLLLLTDMSSRVPVHVGTAGVRAIMLGDNRAEPRLAFLPEGAELNAGDAVVTSGEGGVFPRGLRVGTLVATVDANETTPILRVQLEVDQTKLDFVSVLLATAHGAEEWQDDVDQRRARSATRRAAATRLFGLEGERQR